MGETVEVYAIGSSGEAYDSLSHRSFSVDLDKIRAAYPAHPIILLTEFATLGAPWPTPSEASILDPGTGPQGILLIGVMFGELATQLRPQAPTASPWPWIIGAVAIGAIWWLGRDR